MSFGLVYLNPKSVGIGGLRSLIILIILLALSFNSNGQATETLISVCDKISGAPVSFATITLKSKESPKKSTTITDLNGKANVVISGQVVIHISSIGYADFDDTLDISTSHTVFLIPKAEEIDGVTITAQHNPEKIDKSIYQVKLIGRDIIERRAASNLGDLLKNEAGIRINNDAQLGSSLSLQGISGENVKILVDGVAVEGRMNGSIDLSQLNLNNCSQVEIVEGPMSVIYGSNALAGVVNIITKKNNLPLYLRINAMHESIGIWNADGVISIKKKNHHIALEGGRNFFGGFSDPDTSRSQQWKPKRQWFASLRHSWNHSRNFSTETKIEAFNEKLLNKGALLAPYYETAFDNTFTTQRLTVRNLTSLAITTNHQFQLQSAYQHYQRDKITRFKDLTTLNETITTNPSDHDTSVFNNLSIRGTLFMNTTEKPNQIKIQTGFDLNKEWGEGKRMKDNNQDISDYALFATAKIPLFNQMEVQPGLRWAYNSRYNAPLVWSLNTRLNLLKRYTLRVSYATGFRAPSLKELYLYFVDINHNIQGNENLKAEKSKNLNLSIQTDQMILNRPSSVALTGFYNDMRQVITLAELEPVTYTYINLDKFITAGGSLSWSYQPVNWMRSDIRWALTGKGGYNGLPLKWTNDLSLNLNFIDQKRDIDLSLYYKFNGSMAKYLITSDGSITTGTTEGWHTLDLTISKWLLNHQLMVQIGGKNLFNVTNVSSSGANDAAHSASTTSLPVGWGTSWFIRLTYQISK
ncbi:MAG: TonB-dependent receptor [Sphingobacteriia bacterium]|nr:TonB-dependent receptor [Sphingobacteriia bacterium]